MDVHMATVREIAAAAGVSASTVSRVINGNVPVKDSARNKVLFAIQRLDGKSPQEMNSISGEIGIVMPMSSARNLAAHPSLYTVVLSFISVISERGLGNTTILLDDKSELHELDSHKVRGYLILGTSEEQENKLLPALSAKGLPFIFINRLMGNKHASCINVDDVQSTEMIMDYLFSLGHRDIAFIGGNAEYRNTKLRYSSYKKSLINAGIEPRPDFSFFGEYSEDSGEELGKQFLKLKRRPSAVYAASDPIAIGFMRYLKEQGINLPEELSVVGFGNVEAAAYVTPALTTIAQDSRFMGKVAANTLLQMLDNPIIRCQQVLIGTKLVIRDSCRAV